MYELKRICLPESPHPVGYIARAILSEDSCIYLLDISASDVKVFDFDGNLKQRLFSKGNGPLNLRKPRSLGISKTQIVVGDVGFYAFKVFDASGTRLLRSIFVEGFRPVLGDTKFIDDNQFLTTGFWDGEREYASNSSMRRYPAAVIDSLGRFIKKIGCYPEEYQQYPALDGTAYLDMNNRSEYVITFSQSPAILFGSVKREDFVLWEFVDRRQRYIIPELAKAEPTEEFWKKINLRIFYNTGIYFLNDSVFVRSFAIHNERSVKSGSFVSGKNYCEFFRTDGSLIGEVETKGMLLTARNNLLVVQEKDEPDNQVIVFYKAIFSVSP
ncbi:MAG: hypothetical protein RMI34_10830 [Chloroherpetonaceae bacterium]|nr:hypothetical protein [Chloroherpetonaceae bacterium]MDW8020555.1 hypothetical protein [Chloroherpetonaceae bacterium]